MFFTIFSIEILIFLDAAAKIPALYAGETSDKTQCIFSFLLCLLSSLCNVDAKKAIKRVPHLGLVNPQIADHRVYEGPLVTKQ